MGLRLLIMLGLLALPCFAQREGRGNAGREGRGSEAADRASERWGEAVERVRERRGAVGPEAEAFIKQIRELRERNPKKFEKLKQLRETNPEEFGKRVRAMMRKAREERGGNAAEGKAGGAAQMRRQRRRLSVRFMEHLKEKDPARFEQLRKMREENPEEARKEMRKVFDSFGRKHFSKAKGDGAMKIARKYHREESDGAKTQVREELKQAVQQSFDERIKAKEEQIAKLMEHLQKMKAQLELHRKNREQICEKRVEDLLERAEQGHSKQKDRKAEKAERQLRKSGDGRGQTREKMMKRRRLEDQGEE